MRGAARSSDGHDNLHRLLRKKGSSDYGMDFPDFPRCVTAGKSQEEAKRMAAKALKLHIAGLLEDRQIIPGPSGPAVIMADSANLDAVAFLVDTQAAP